MAAPPRPAATLVLLRDGASGIEVFMLRRHPEDSVLAHAYVFPGGKVDREDSDDESIERLGLPLQALHQRLGEPDLAPHDAAAVFMAAYRETFEETGVLLSPGVDGALADEATRMRREGYGFVEVLQRFELSLDPAALHPFSRWVTPRASTKMRRRFDTRFFVGRVPAGQTPRHDLSETAGGEWLKPREAVLSYARQEIDLAAPQIMTLSHLSHFTDVDAVLAEARRRPPPLIAPVPFETEAGRVVAYPGDERHSIRERVMPGPTRLLFAAGRFQPVEGTFEDWFR